MAESVKLYVYDLSRGLAAAYGPALGIDIDGVWHTAVVVDNKEIYFGSMEGITVVNGAGRTHLGAPDRVVDLGTTEVDWPLIQEYIEEAKDRYSAHHYNLLQNNCNHFSNDFSQFLTGTKIPDYIISTAAKVSQTPLGQMLATQFNTGVSPI